MEFIGTFKFENPGEAEIYAEVLGTYPAVKKAEKLEQIGDIVLVRAVGRGAAKGVLNAAAETFVTEGRYPWTETLPKKNN